MSIIYSIIYEYHFIEIHEKPPQRTASISNIQRYQPKKNVIRMNAKYKLFKK